MRAIDLGCGTGELTAVLHRFLGPGAEVVGIDASRRMLEGARRLERPGLRFELGDLATDVDFGAWDLVFSNAALHWIDDHPAFFERLVAALRPGAQLAVQMPRNDDHPSHALVREVASTPAWRERLHGFVRRSPVLPAEAYARILKQGGFVRPKVLERVYLHPLASVDEVIEWTKGSTLTPYLARLSGQDAAAFVEAYRSRLHGVLGTPRPYLYTFRRLFLWGVKGR